MISLPQAFWDRLQPLSLGPNEIAMESRVPAGSSALEELRDLGERAGDHLMITLADGSVRAIPDHGGDQLTIAPPSKLCPPLSGDPLDVEIQSYNDGFDGDWFNVELQVDRSRTRDPSSTPIVDEVATDNEWELGFTTGTLALRSHQIESVDRKGPARQLNCTLDNEQAQVIDATLGTIAAVSKRDVTGGDDYRTDNHPNDRNTVAVTPRIAVREWVPASEWVVTSWTLDWAAPDRWECSLTIAGPVTAFDVPTRIAAI